MRILVCACALLVLPAWAQAPQQPTESPITATEAAPAPPESLQSFHAKFAAYWAEREKQRSREAFSLARSAQWGPKDVTQKPLGFPRSRDSDDQIDADDRRLERESQERRTAIYGQPRD